MEESAALATLKAHRDFVVEAVHYVLAAESPQEDPFASVFVDTYMAGLEIGRPGATLGRVDHSQMEDRPLGFDATSVLLASLILPLIVNSLNQIINGEISKARIAEKRGEIERILGESIKDKKKVKRIADEIIRRLEGSS